MRIARRKARALAAESLQLSTQAVVLMPSASSAVACSRRESHCRCVTAQAQEGLSCMMFVELLFWKNSREAMDVRNEYHWKVSSIALQGCSCKLTVHSILSEAVGHLEMV